MNTGIIKSTSALACAAALAVLSACDSDNILTEDSSPAAQTVNTNAGTPSHKHLSLLASDPAPAVIDTTTGTFTETTVDLTIKVADRNDLQLSNAHTVFFRTEYGVLSAASCVTENSECSIQWIAQKRPEPTDPINSNGLATIVAYVRGEEKFVDSNGNGFYDDNDASFTDLEEPYVDVDESGAYNAGDLIIDVPNPVDPAGNNGLHDPGDGLFNGANCGHLTLCSTTTNIYIWDAITLDITGP